MNRHAAAVAEIASKVRQFYDLKVPFRISHGSTNSTRLSTRRENQIIDTSALRHVIKVDVQKKTALVEPNVPMDKLADATMKYGLIPPVVMEFPGITAGGGYAGTSGESSSFKHGFFDRTVREVEMVLADGEIIKANESEKADLFHGAAGALGSMGITTLLEINLEDAHSHVETTYHPVSSISEAVSKIHELTTRTDLDYVDGILFSPTHGVLVTGRRTNNPDPSHTTRTFTNSWDPWFYLHAQSTTTKNPNPQNPTVESIPLYDYLFRYDRGGFWVGRSAFHYMLNFPFNRFTRWFLDDFLRTRMLYKALHASGYSRQYVVQDLALPYETAEQFIDYTVEKFNIWPLWLCPLKQSPAPTMHPHIIPISQPSHSTISPPSDPSSLPPMLNIGLWGFAPPTSSCPRAFTALNLDLEARLKQFGGMKWLYATAYYSSSQFWEMFDKKWYDSLRKKYRAESLPSTFDKVKGKGSDVSEEEEEGKEGWKMKSLRIRPIGGLYGIWKAMWSGEWRGVRRGRWESIDLTGVEEETEEERKAK
ncbi:putative 24-dehydrocholesterol reductase precursor [Phaeomoniella chlamydospora]|uniref:Delta(24)-sterol reductase n=1 Tax=Phaeomoniella chlamydospora TaxID=158046 RepID=A0A0G2HF09_PHACM|nr:putative 24-dehydrocholesterol reductase precursor [Phaeomoniella chlamydospora]